MQFPWSDFEIEEVSSMPSSSRNTGKAPMVPEVDDEEASDSEYDDEDDGDATEEDSK